MKGRFYCVGVGPGDPELLTLKGYRILREVPVICYPESAQDRESIARSIVSALVGEGKEYLGLRFPMVRDRAALEPHWEEAAERVLAQLVRGRDVAFITLGDPAFYSTYGYLVKKLREKDPGVRMETVPGVTSFSAGAAALNLTLAEGGERVAVIPAGADPAGLGETLRDFESVVLLKVHRAFPRLLEILDEAGRRGESVFLSRVGAADGFAETDLDALRGRELDYLSMVLVREGGVGR